MASLKPSRAASSEGCSAICVIPIETLSVSADSWLPVSLDSPSLAGSLLSPHADKNRAAPAKIALNRNKFDLGIITVFLGGEEPTVIYRLLPPVGTRVSPSGHFRHFQCSWFYPRFDRFMHKHRKFCRKGSTSARSG